MSHHLDKLLVFACISAAPAEKVTYDDHVRPIFEDKCFSCHNPDKTKGGLDLTTFAGTMAGSSSGEIVAAGAPGDSILHLVTIGDEEPVMPPKGGLLKAASLKTLSAWIAGGLLESSGSTAQKKKKPAFSTQVASVSLSRPEGPPPMPGDLPLAPVVPTTRSTAVADIAAAPWSPVVATTGQKQVQLYHSETLEPLGILPFPGGSPFNVGFSRNGTLAIASGGRPGKSGKLVVWNIETGAPTIELDAGYDSLPAADLHPAQTHVALGGASKTVDIYDTADGARLHTLGKHTEWITAIAFSPDGTMLATADRNGGLLIWESTSGAELFTLEGHKEKITALDWRADSAAIVSSSDKDGQLRLWDPKTGKKIKDWGAHKGGTLSVNFAADGRIVSSGRTPEVKLWDGGGKQLRVIKVPTTAVTAAAFPHDGKAVLATGWDGTLHQFSSETGELAKSTPTHFEDIGTRVALLEKSQDTPEKERSLARFQAAAARISLDDAKQVADEAGKELAAVTSKRPNPELLKAAKTQKKLLESQIARLETIRNSLLEKAEVPR